MHARTKFAFIVLISAIVVASFAIPAASADELRISRTTVNDVLAKWSIRPRDAANKLIAKYGLPNEIAASRLTWFNNGPWKRTIVFRKEVPHNFPKPHTDFVQQFIDYRVPADRFDDLAAYDGSVIAERTKGEISARCDKEEMNFLALNLANDIVNTTRSVEDARRFYADTAMAFMKGEKPAYTTGLQFTPQAAGTADLDVTTIAPSVLSSLPPPPEPSVSPAVSQPSINPNDVRVTRNGVNKILASWPSHPRDAANKLIAKYGLPKEATASMLTWFNNGSWKRTIVYRDEIPHNFPKPHTDFVEQFIDYRVPSDKFDELAAYDGSVISERTKGEISARCDKEEMNRLALNLANDIVKGTKNIEQARQFYADTAVAAMKGEKPSYTTALQFSRPAVQTADRDISTIPQPMISSAKETTTTKTPVRKQKPVRKY
jgi:hypothetical protein